MFIQLTEARLDPENDKLISLSCPILINFDHILCIRPLSQGCMLSSNFCPEEIFIWESEREVSLAIQAIQHQSCEEIEPRYGEALTILLRVKADFADECFPPGKKQKTYTRVVQFLESLKKE